VQPSQAILRYKLDLPFASTD